MRDGIRIARRFPVAAGVLAVCSSEQWLRSSLVRRLTRRLRGPRERGCRVCHRCRRCAAPRCCFPRRIRIGVGPGRHFTAGKQHTTIQSNMRNTMVTSAIGSHPCTVLLRCARIDPAVLARMLCADHRPPAVGCSGQTWTAIPRTRCDRRRRTEDSGSIRTTTTEASRCTLRSRAAFRCSLLHLVSTPRRILMSTAVTATVHARGGSSRDRAPHLRVSTEQRLHRWCRATQRG